MTGPVVLGIDISPRRLGWGVVTLDDGRPIACGMERIDLPDHGWAHQQIRNALAAAEAEWGPPHEVCFVAVERPAVPRMSGTNSALNAGRALQEAVSACRRRWPHAPIEELQPAEWRKLAGLAGNATKADVRDAAFALASDHAATWVEAQDAADALLIALAGQRRNEEIHHAAMARDAQGRTVGRWEDDAA